MSFEKLTKRNAKAFFDLYIARKDAVLEQFKQRFASDTGQSTETLDYSPESLVPLWVWVRDRVPKATEHPDLSLMPPWYEYEVKNNSHSGGIFFTPEAAHTIDGLAYYFGETLIRHIPDAQWRIGSYPNSPYYCKPCIESDYVSAYPVGNMTIAALVANDKTDRRNAHDRLAAILIGFQEQEARYKAACVKAGGHIDPSVKKRVRFE